MRGGWPPNAAMSAPTTQRHPELVEGSPGEAGVVVMPVSREPSAPSVQRADTPSEVRPLRRRNAALRSRPPCPCGRPSRPWLRVVAGLRSLIACVCRRSRDAGRLRTGGSLQGAGRARSARSGSGPLALIAEGDDRRPRRPTTPYTPITWPSGQPSITNTTRHAERREESPCAAKREHVQSRATRAPGPRLPNHGNNLATWENPRHIRQIGPHNPLDGHRPSCFTWQPDNNDASTPPPAGARPGHHILLRA